jgi:hypothetical protein
MPSWIFTASIRNTRDFEQWLKKANSGLSADTFKRADNTSGTIIQLKRTFGSFFSFCYTQKENKLYFTYSSQLLKRAVLQDKRTETGEEGAAFLVTVSAPELIEFIKAKKIYDLLKQYQWFDITKISDLDTLGKGIGVIEGKAFIEHPDLRLLIRSKTGVTGLYPFIIFLEHKCHLKEK